MSFSVNRDLFRGTRLPLAYDLVFGLSNNVPVFVLTAAQELFEELDSSCPGIEQLAGGISGLGKFEKSQERIGFGGIFQAQPTFLPIDGYQSWQAEFPTEVIRPVGSQSNNWAGAYQLSATLAFLSNWVKFNRRHLVIDCIA